MGRRIRIFDTTLRDGEQTPGVNLNISDKLRIAHVLAGLGVDVIEAGFPASSRDDFMAVRRISEQVKRPVVCALARAEDARRSDRCAVKPLLDVFVLCNAYDGAWNEDYIRALAETYGLAAVLRDTEKLYGCYFAQKHRDGYYFKALDSFFAPGRKSLPPAAAGPLRRARRKRAKTAAIYVSAAAVVVATVVICSNCGAATLYHRVCPECGFYRGKLAIEKKAAE